MRIIAKIKVFLISAAMLTMAVSGPEALADNDMYNVSEDGTTLTQTRTITDDEVPEAEPEIEYNGSSYELSDVSTSEASQLREVSYSEIVTLTSANDDIPEKVEKDGVEYTLVNKDYKYTITKTETLTSEDILSKTVEYTEPDNNIDRLPLTIEYAGMTLELITIDYTVTAADRYGVPTEYKASCYYATNVKSVTEIPVEYQVEAEYIGYFNENEKYVTYTYTIVNEPESETETAAETEEIKKAEDEVKSNVPVIVAATGGGIAAVTFGWWLLFKKEKKKEKK